MGLALIKLSGSLKRLGLNKTNNISRDVRATKPVRSFEVKYQ